MARNIERKPTDQIIAGLAWYESFGCFTSTIAGFLKLEVAYEGDKGYKATVGGLVLKQRTDDCHNSCRLAIAFAKQVLAKAQAELVAADKVEKKV
jgi:hypothetical protein